MKHSESIKIHQVSRYHGNVMAVYSMIVLLTEYVEISEASSTMRELAERSLIGTYLYSLCVKPDTSTLSP